MSNELKCSPGDWKISWNTFNGGEAHGIYDSNSFDIRGSQIAIVSELPGIDPTTDEEMGKANAHLIAASKDLYSALNKIHSECHKLLNRGTNEKLSVSDCLTIIGAIGETCEKPLKAANPSYKP